jgi:nucleotide-binding universal stress UspA family protein
VDTSARKPIGWQQRGIVVGVDGSSGSLRALRWALAREDRFGATQPVMVWEYPLWSSASLMAGAGAMPPAEQMQDAASEAAIATLEAEAPELVDRVVVREGSTATVLLEQAEEASLLVVGSRGHGALMSALMHSVGASCAAHTPVPLVVVPDDTDHAPGGETILVGIDGSENSDEALAWALSYAGPGDTITAVGVWGIPAVTGFEQVVLEPEAIESGTRDMVDDAVARVCARVGADSDHVSIEIRQGDSRSVLRSMSEDADVLVLGARGAAGIAHWLFGSVTTSLVHRPICPTVVIPHDE